jgi:hypothetical protein
MAAVERPDATSMRRDNVAAKGLISVVSTEIQPIGTLVPTPGLAPPVAPAVLSNRVTQCALVRRNHDTGPIRLPGKAGLDLRSLP